MTPHDRLCTETLAEPIKVSNPTIVLDIKDYESGWAEFSAAIQRVSQRFQSFSEFLAESGIDIYDESHEMSDNDLADALGRQRDAPWGFAVGDRVRMTKLGYSGHVTSSEECPFGSVEHKPSDPFCHQICPNVAFRATHRLHDDGTIEKITEGDISCPPADLEHTD